MKKRNIVIHFLVILMMIAIFAACAATRTQEIAGEYEAVLKKSSLAYESAVKQLKQMESAAMETVGEMEEKVDKLAGIGKEALHDTKGHLTRAVNAAVHAAR